jgi:hypothetical protein
MGIPRSGPGEAADTPVQDAGMGRNPLRRPIDLVEAGMIAGLVLLFVIAAPVLATMAGRWTRATVTPEQRADICQPANVGSRATGRTQPGWSPGPRVPTGRWRAGREAQKLGSGQPGCRGGKRT